MGSKQEGTEYYNETGKRLHVQKGGRYILTGSTLFMCPGGPFFGDGMGQGEVSGATPEERNDPKGATLRLLLVLSCEAA